MMFNWVGFEQHVKAEKKLRKKLLFKIKNVLFFLCVFLCVLYRENDCTSESSSDQILN